MSIISTYELLYDLQFLYYALSIRRREDNTTIELAKNEI